MSFSVVQDECGRARESISARLDSELSELDSAHLNAHLRRCPECAAHARELAGLTVALREAALEQPGVPVWVPQRRRAVALRRVPLRAAAAAAAVAALSFVAGHYAGSGVTKTVTVIRPVASSPNADLLDRQVVAMVREAHSKRTPPAGRLTFA
jgi:anti-sigma factor RsiW